MASTIFAIKNRIGVGRGAFKHGAGTASSPRFVGSTAFYRDEPSPPLYARFLERNRKKDSSILLVVLLRPVRYECAEQFRRKADHETFGRMDNDRGTDWVHSDRREGLGWLRRQTRPRQRQTHRFHHGRRGVSLRG